MPITNRFNHYLPRRVRALRRFTWALLIGEWLVGLCWPPICLALVYLGFVLIGGLESLPKFVQPLILAATLIGMAGLIIWRWPRLLPPQRARIDQRLMLAARLRINPFAALEDRPAQAMATAQQLWQVAGQQQQNLWPRLQRPKLRPLLLLQDPRGLRYLALLAFGIAFISAGPLALDRLYLALQPAALQSAGNWLGAHQFTITLNPPAFTGQNTRVLTTRQTVPLTLPQGTAIDAEVQGGFLRPRLRLNGERVKLIAMPNGYRFNGIVNTGDTIALYQGWRELARWPVNIIAASPPKILLGDLEYLDKGRFTIPWSAQDVYGLQKIELQISAAKKVSVIEIPLWQAPTHPPIKAIEQWSPQDWAAHRLAGQPVRLLIRATNTAGLTTDSGAINFTMPAREFTHPIAKMLAAQRQALWADPASLTGLQQTVTTALTDPAVRHDTQNDLALQAAAQQVRGKTFLAAPEVETLNALLWRVAVRLEDGAKADNIQNLQNAAEALQQGLQNQLIDIRDLSRLTDRYGQALQDYWALTPPSGWNDQRLQQALQILADGWQLGRRAEALVQLQELQQTLLHNGQAPNSDTVMPTGTADPLGRPVAVAGAQSSGVAVPITADMRAQGRAILNELRDRANAPDTDSQAQDYYQRLLKLND